MRQKNQPFYQIKKYESQNPEIENYIQQFFNTIRSLDKKITIFLLQFPPRFGFSAKHLNQLKTILNTLPDQGRYMLELRNNTWFDPQILVNIADGKRIMVGTTYIEGIDAYYHLDQSVYYIRVIYAEM